MVANTVPIFVKTPMVTALSFVAADGTTPKTIFDPPTDGGKCFSIECCSDDTATVYMQVFIHNGTANFLIGTVPVLTLAGTNGILSAVNLLDRLWIPCLDIDNELFLPDTYTLRVAPKVAVTAAKTVNLVGFSGGY
jgi:hypothetical protein